MYGLYFSVNKANIGAAPIPVDMSLRFNPNPDVQLTNFISKLTLAGNSSAANPHYHKMNARKFSGPGILKVQVLTGTNNLDISAGFDFIVEENQ